MARRSTVRPDGRTLIGGAVTGLGTFGVGYVLTYAWRAPAVNEMFSGLNFLANLLGVESIPTWKAVAWLFYGAHGATTEFPRIGGGTELVNLVERSGGEVALLYALVVVLLLLAGATTAWLAGADTTREAGIAGATIATGYAIAATAGTVATAHPIGGAGAHIAPEPVTAVLLAGVLYPVVFGTIGGILARYARDRLAQRGRATSSPQGSKPWRS